MIREIRCFNKMLMVYVCAFQEFPMHEIESSKLKNTLSARLQPVSFEINNLLLLLFDDVDVDVLAVGVCELELELDFIMKIKIKKQTKKIEQLENGN